MTAPCFGPAGDIGMIFPSHSSYFTSVFAPSWSNSASVQNAPFGFNERAPTSQTPGTCREVGSSTSLAAGTRLTLPTPLARRCLLALCVERDFIPKHSLTAADAGGVAHVGFEGGHDGFLAAEAFRFHLRLELQDALVILRDHFHEAVDHAFPIGEDFCRSRALGIGLMALDEFPKLFDFVWVGQLIEVNHLLVDARGEIAGFIEHVGDATRHARREIASGLAEDDHPAAGHVFATVIADGF